MTLKYRQSINHMVTHEANIAVIKSKVQEERCSNVYQVGSLRGFLCVTFWIFSPKFPKYFQQKLYKNYDNDQLSLQI